jgi:HEAT repeat protein
VPLLAAALEDSAFKVRQAVARALGKIGGEAAAKILRTMLQDRDYNVRNAAREALDGLQ